MIFYNYEEVFVMDYSQEYKQKLVSADEAVKLIKSGDWVDFGWMPLIRRWQNVPMS